MEQEQAKQEPKKKPSLRELLDTLAQQKEAESLTFAFADALKGITNEEMRIASATHALISVVTGVVESNAKNLDDPEEMATALEAELKKQSDYLATIPNKYRDWAKRQQEKARQAPADALDLLAVILGSCNCEHCMAFKKASKAEQEQASEVKTDPPPAPAAGQEATP